MQTKSYQDIGNKQRPIFLRTPQYRDKGLCGQKYKQTQDWKIIFALKVNGSKCSPVFYNVLAFYILCRNHWQIKINGTPVNQLAIKKANIGVNVCEPV